MTDYHRPDAKKLQGLIDIANKLRIHSIKATDASNSGLTLYQVSQRGVPLAQSSTSASLLHFPPSSILGLHAPPQQPSYPPPLGFMLGAIVEKMRLRKS
ncbi:hypothetical protein FSP39_010739 [Pinctada imbricata]|uniref:Uncharacterized protein n=1 Tax=Pinctada imbricata TaxID=66713 RepID=A0AA88YQQ5_PINIB|nr:hypothetical protein FSP39_010739 [Pinctada imbricata]